MLPGNGRSEWFKDHPLAPEMVIIPKGQFIMGSPAGEEGREEDTEGPQHSVSIAAPFALGRFAVTLAEFGAFVEATGHAMPDEMYTFENDKWETRKSRSFRNPGFAQTPRPSRGGSKLERRSSLLPMALEDDGKGLSPAERSRVGICLPGRNRDAVLVWVVDFDGRREL
jgi:formylglycine-generating enzyme required for sulfatase activity